MEAKIIGIDRKTRLISLSVKAKDEADDREAIANLKDQPEDAAGPKTIGDLIKAQMGN